MSSSLARVAIVYKNRDHPAHGLAVEMAEWLAERGVTAAVHEHRRRRPALPEDDPAPDLLVVLGGDGTMLGEARRLEPPDIPLVGLNMGRVGFLTGLSRETWREAFADMMARGFEVKSRMMLSVSVLRDGRDAFSCHAVNDAVVSRGAVARLIKLRVRAGGEDLGRLRADGVVVAAPGGATAYCVSAGGPLVHPDLDVVVVAPICPFLDAFKPLVLPGDTVVDIGAAEGDGELHLTADGQETFPLRPGDLVRVRKAERRLCLAVAPGESYFRKLRDKGFLPEP